MRMRHRISDPRPVPGPVAGRRPSCRSGFTREEAGPAGQCPWPVTVAAATVFAGKPAPTPIGGGTDRWLGADRRVGAGLPAKRPVLRANVPGRSPLLPPPYSRVNPLLRRSGGGHRSVVGRRPSCRSGFTRERAGPAGQYPWPITAPLVGGHILQWLNRCWRHVGVYAGSNYRSLQG